MNKKRKISVYPRSSVANFLRILAIATLLLTSDGCALFTARRVGTFAAKQVGKKVIKDAKKDHDEKKKNDQRNRENKEPDQLEEDRD